ncbi:MAG TPA: hypothetical protein VID03_07580 [Acidimicrobiia bacterium]
MNNAYARRPRSVWLWTLGAVIVVGAGVAAYLTQPPPPTEYRATAVVAPPTVVQSSLAGLNQFVTDLTERMGTDAIVIPVLEEVPQLDPEEYLEGIEANRLGATSLLEIAFIHPDKEVAQRTVEAVAGQIVAASARPEFDESAHLLDQAAARLDQAQQNLQTFTAANEVYDPKSEYAGAIEQISAIDRQIATATIEGVDASALEVLESQKAELITQRDRVGALLLSYDSLASEVTRAQEEWERVSARFEEAEYEFTVVNTPAHLIVSRGVEPVADQTPRLQQTALAAALALALTLAVLVPLGIWLANRRVKKHRRSLEATPSIRETSPDAGISVLVYEHQ